MSKYSASVFAIIDNLWNCDMVYVCVWLCVCGDKYWRGSGVGWGLKDVKRLEKDVWAFMFVSFSVSEAVENDIGLRGPTESGNRQKMKKGTCRMSHKTLFCDVPMQNGGGGGGVYYFPCIQQKRSLTDQAFICFGRSAVAWDFGPQGHSAWPSLHSGWQLKLGVGLTGWHSEAMGVWRAGRLQPLSDHQDQC